MRLIDADKIDFNKVFKGQSDFAKDTRKTAQSLIDAQPTAYDMEKVVEQLENLDLGGIRMQEDGKYYLIRQSEAIEIVKAGGVNG